MKGGKNGESFNITNAVTKNWKEKMPRSKVYKSIY